MPSLILVIEILNIGKEVSKVKAPGWVEFNSVTRLSTLKGQP